MSIDDPLRKHISNTLLPSLESFYPSVSLPLAHTVDVILRIFNKFSNLTIKVESRFVAFSVSGAAMLIVSRVLAKN
jgi:hypothetical protein